MKISREIDGKNVDIELTNDEVWWAFQEQEERFALNDLNTWLEDKKVENVEDEKKKRIANVYLKHKDDEWYEWMSFAYDYIERSEA